jgi:hypothetical protein
VFPNHVGSNRPRRLRWLGDMTPSGIRGVLNDAVSLYFADATLASAFVVWWCVGSKVETSGGVFQCARTSRRRGAGRVTPDAVN